MPPTHHPRPEALADFLIGNCSPGAALLITQHTQRCTRCAGRVRAMGAVNADVAELRYGSPRSLGPGLEGTPLIGVSGLGEAVFHLKVDPGCETPVQALHIAEILILEGALKVDGERYAPGDLLSVEARPDARVVAHATKGCACLVVADDAADEPQTADGTAD